jgi:hypothetical protein
MLVSCPTLSPAQHRPWCFEPACERRHVLGLRSLGFDPIRVRLQRLHPLRQRRGQTLGRHAGARWQIELRGQSVVECGALTLLIGHLLLEQHRDLGQLRVVCGARWCAERSALLDVEQGQPISPFVRGIGFAHERGFEGTPFGVGFAVGVQGTGELAKQAAQAQLRRLGVCQLGGMRGCTRFLLLACLVRRLALRLGLGVCGLGLVLGLPALTPLLLQLGPGLGVVAVVQSGHVGVSRARQRSGQGTQTRLGHLALRPRPLLAGQSRVERQGQSAHGFALALLQRGQGGVTGWPVRLCHGLQGLQLATDLVEPPQLPVVRFGRSRCGAWGSRHATEVRAWVVQLGCQGWKGGSGSGHGALCQHSHFRP